MFRVLTRLALPLSLAACATAPAPRADAPPPVMDASARAPVTILISIDGFSPDYLGRGDSPTLDALAAGGVTGPMRPSFPSKTFPNHYTLVTGLRPDEHGITGNAMIDPRRPGERFTLSNAKQAQDPFWWDQAEPIWVTAEKAGIRTATMFWPGSDVAIHGTYPSDWARYYEPFPYAQRVRAIRDWLARADPAERPRLLTLYFEDVDTRGHKSGPGAPETRAAVRAVDSAIARLRADLAALRQPANLVIVSDHGMARVEARHVVRLPAALPGDAYTLVNSGALTEIEPVPGRAAQVEAALLGRRDGYRCWRKGELPARFHYGRNMRVPAIVCLSDTGFELVGPDAKPWENGGDHGFDPADPAMRALFIAHGPAVRAGARVPAFDNVEVYALVARLAGVPARPNRGSAGFTASVLR